MTSVEFTINGRAYSIKSTEVSIETTLNWYIRNYVQLRGTKSLCLEGGCGACTVTVTGLHPVTREVKTFAINSCLTPILSCHGWDITTIEGMGNKLGYDRTQTRIVLFNGVQCGFCTPGMVMNMNGLLQSNNGNVTQEQVERAFGGNICRCTGYRPILDGYKSLASNADPILAKLCSDIEDLKLCKKTGKQCAGECKTKKQPKNKLELYFPANREWHKVYTLNEIFDIFSTIGNKKYMLIAGNTAHGVYRRDPEIEVFIDITSVPDLRTYAFGTELEIGGGVTITELIDIFQTAVNTRPEFAILTDAIKTLNSFGNIQIRNIASVAGNLILKNQYNDFVSDLYVILETLNARITIVESGGRITDLSPINFLRLQMSQRVVLRITIPSRSTAFVFKSYRVLPRAQCAPPYLNAGFLLEFNAAKTSVLSARIVYGGISAAFNRASATELYLTGQNLFTNNIFRVAVSILQQEISAVSTPPSASAEYKNQLAISLFYRFVINTAPAGIITARYQSGGNPLERGLSSGTQSFQTQPDRYPLSLVMHRVDGFVQAGGETPFANDLPKLPDELWAAVVQAKNVHATITSISASEALLIPGVRHFYSASNIPGTNSFTSTSLSGFAEELFCSGRVLYHGQAVGVILADTQDLAVYAASKVTVTYGAATDPILTSLEAVFASNATSRIIPGNHNMVATQTGTDIQYTINGQFEMGTQFHFSLEPQTCIAIPTEDGLTLHTSTQWMGLVQSSVAQVLRIPENRLNIETRRLGGGFGSKLTRASFAACVAALGAHLAQVPVRYVMTLESNMEILGKRHPCISDYLVHVNRDGKIQNLNSSYYSDLGCSRNDNVEDNLTRFLPNCYDVSTWNVQSNSVLTDTPSSTFTRSPGMLEGMAITESIMEHIAFELGREPTAVRLENIPDSREIKAKFNEFLTSVEYTTRKNAIETYNTNNRWTKRGISAVPLQYPHIFFGQFQCIVSIHHADGTVSISHGGIEMGQGITTRVCQVAAHTLGIPIFNIAVKPTNNVIGGNCSVSGGSITSDTVCMAVLNACKNLNQRLEPLRQQFPNASWTELVAQAQFRNIQLSELFQQPPADMPNYDIYAFTCAEIEVDVLTGNFILRRVDILEDVGESYSPLADVGQIEGGFVMGLGLWLSEKYVYGVGGELLTNRTWNYLPPGANDIPVDFRVSFFKDSRNDKIVLGSKIVGEPPVLMSISAVFALRNALWSARRDAGMQYVWRPLKGPYTVENIFLTSGTNSDQFNL